MYLPKVAKVQIVLRWAEEGEEGWEYQEQIFTNVHVFARYLKTRKDLANYLDYIPKNQRRRF